MKTNVSTKGDNKLKIIVIVMINPTYRYQSAVMSLYVPWNRKLTVELVDMPAFVSILKTIMINAKFKISKKVFFII